MVLTRKILNATKDNSVLERLCNEVNAPDCTMSSAKRGNFGRATENDTKTAPERVTTRKTRDTLGCTHSGAEKEEPMHDAPNRENKDPI